MALYKVLRHQSAAKIIHFHKPCISLLQPPRIAKPLDQIPVSSVKESHFASPTPSSSALQFFPAFSCGFFLNPTFPPISSTGFEPDEDMPPEDSRTVRADSVKKKRKVKMNKHKLRKLRRRLRRKT